jgi:DNA (cytosine-5)-methyltransferase 1
MVTISDARTNSQDDKEIRFLDLFSGCGGMSWGFKSAGLIPVAGVEILEDPADSYFANLGVPGYCTQVSDFVDDCKTFLSSGNPADYWSEGFSESLGLGIDVLIGGPPCQGYSALGKMSRKSDRIQVHSMLNDLWNDFLDAVNLFRPRAIVVENIPLFGKSQGFSQFISRLSRLNYHVISEVLNAADYGVPQVRKRLFTIAIKDSPPTFPKPSQSGLTVRDAIGKLPLEPDGINWHVGRRPTAKSKERYRVIPPGGNRFDLMKDRPDITPR